MGSREALNFQAARMVLDYLGDRDLKRTKEAFLDECVDLKDPLRFLDLRGFIITSLMDMLEEYLAIKKSLDEIVFNVFVEDKLPIYKTDGVLRKLDVLKSHLKSKKASSTHKIKEPTPKKVVNSALPPHRPTTPLKPGFISLSSTSTPSPKRLDSSISIRITPVKDTQNHTKVEKPSRKRCLNFNPPPVHNPPRPHQIKQYLMGLKVALTPYVYPNNIIVDLSGVPRSLKPRVAGASNTLNILSDVAHCLQLGASVNKNNAYPFSGTH